MLLAKTVTELNKYRLIKLDYFLVIDLTKYMYQHLIACGVNHLAFYV